MRRQVCPDRVAAAIYLGGFVLVYLLWPPSG